MTQRAASSPADVSTASPSPIGAAARDSSSTAGPPARAIAAATPPPCSSRVFAALAIASTSSAVMSASSASRAAIASTVPAMTVRKRVRAHGRVQGVFFRDSVRRAAERRCRGLGAQPRPTAPSRPCSRARPEAVERLVELCRDGPGHAEVTRLEVAEEPPEGLAGLRRAADGARSVGAGLRTCDRRHGSRHAPPPPPRHRARRRRRRRRPRRARPRRGRARPRARSQAGADPAERAGRRDRDRRARPLARAGRGQRRLRPDGVREGLARGRGRVHRQGARRRRVARQARRRRLRAGERPPGQGARAAVRRRVRASPSSTSCARS